MTVELTQRGIDALLYALEKQKPIVFDKILIGNGADAGNNPEKLSNPQLDSAIDGDIKRSTDGNFVTLTCSFSNSNSKVQSRFRVTETGVTIKDPSNDSKTVLFAYGYVDDSIATVIPAPDDCLFEITQRVIVYVGVTANVSKVVLASSQYATKAEVDAHISSRTNPHGVTAAQVGLGSVPNVATNDQTPTYATAKTAKAPESGEKLSVAFGKIRRAVLDLIAHIGSKDNPHGVTAEQIKAAQKSHTHSAADITSGILGITRGGTGVSDLNTLAQSISDLHVVTGTYKGTGTYGSNNKTSLTFTRTPKVLLVQPTENGNQKYAQKYAGFIVQQGVKQNTNGGVADDALIGSLYFEWNGRTVAWYSDYISSGIAAGFQCNLKDAEYRYIAIL